MTSPYHKNIRRNAEGLSDVYDVLRAFEVTDPAVAHAVKKLLAPGKRNGGKPLLQDLDEAIWSLNSAKEALGEESEKFSFNRLHYSGIGDTMCVPVRIKK